MKFHHNDKVRFNKNNFLYGKKGIIKGYSQNKDGSFNYKVVVSIDDKEQEKDVQEKDLYKAWF